MSFETILSNKKVSLAILLLIILVAIGLRIYSFRGFGTTDAAEYAILASQITKGTFTPGSYQGPAVFPLRVGLIYPTALAFQVFGVNEWSLSLYPFILSLLSLLLIYYCASHLFGTAAGLLGATIYAVIPNEIYEATILAPDLPSGFFAALGLTCVLTVVSYRNKSKGIHLLVGLVAGFSFGLSWLCKSAVVFYVPLTAFILFITLKKDFPRYAYLWIGVAVGSLGVLFTEASIYRYINGDWLFRFSEIERNYLQWNEWFFKEGSKFGWAVGTRRLFALMKRVLMGGPEMIFLSQRFLYLPLFAMLAVFHAWYWKDKRFFYPSLWFMGLLLMYNFSTCSLSAYEPLILMHRYFGAVYFPAAILVAGLIVKLLTKEDQRGQLSKSNERFFWGIMLVATLAIIGSYSTFRILRDQSTIGDDLRTVSRLLTSSDIVYTDPLTSKGLEFYWKYPDFLHLNDFSGKSEEDIPSGSYVLIDKYGIKWLNDDNNRGMWLNKHGYPKPTFFENPPSSWRKLWTGNHTPIYLYMVPK